MSTSAQLDTSDRELIRRCRKSLETLPGLVTLTRILFWLSLVLGILGLGVVLSLVFFRGSESVSERLIERLVGGWLWIGLLYLAARTLRSEEQLTQLVCKLTAEVPAPAGENASPRS